MSQTSPETNEVEKVIVGDGGNIIEVVRSSSGISSTTHPPDVPEIRTEVTPSAPRRERSVVIEYTRRKKTNDEFTREECSIMCTFIGTIIAVVLIYVFVNMKLVRNRDECSRNKANDKVIATLITKGDWYIFRYKTLECVAPQDNSLTGKENGTNIPIFVSSNLKNCAYPEYDDTDCKHQITTFNVLYTWFGVGVTAGVMFCLCSCFCGLDPMRHKTEM